jgi:hypothetical protein
MSFHLQRVRFTVRTKDQFLAGTNAAVRLWFEVDETQNHPEFDQGLNSIALDHPMHDDFQRGKSDSYELDLVAGKSSGRLRGKTPIPNGLEFGSLEDARSLHFHIEIAGKDRWIFDRYALGGYFVEMRPVAGSKDEFEVIELGWIEMAKHKGDVSMSSDPKEGVAEYDIELNGKFQ